MKKLLLALALVATSVATWADRWTAPSSTTYPNETPLYVTVDINVGVTSTQPTITEIAAFIDGECRAQATETITTQNGTEVYVLRVRGGEADQGKAITIKALYEGLVYKFVRTETFDGDAQLHDVPLALTLNPLLGISLDEDPIELTLGEDAYNLAEHLTYQYGEDNAGDKVAPVDQEETPLTVTYSAGNYVARFTVDEEGMLSPVSEGRGVVSVSVEGPRDATGYQALFETRANVVVSKPAVEQIVVNPTELTVYVGDNLNDLFQNGRLSISMLPENADQGYRFSSTGAAMPWDANYGFTTAGDFDVLVYSTANSDLDPVTLTIHVKEPLSFSLGEDAYVGLIGMVTPMEFNVYFNSLDDFDASLLTISTDGADLPTAPIAYKIGKAAASTSEAAGDAYYVPVTLTGRYVGQWNYEILYNGDPIADIFNAIVVPEIQIQNGWQWTSPYAYEEGNEVGNFCIDGTYQTWVTDDIIEMRTQEGLLYVDANLGAFGDIIDFNFMNGMYKVKSKGERVLRLGTSQDTWQLAQYNDGTQLENGYNWVVYPYEFALGLDEVEGTLSDYAHEGDQIISKDGGFAEYSDGAWVHDGFTFQPGTGYMYYYTDTESGQFAPYFDIYGNTPQCYQTLPVNDDPDQPLGVRRRAQARQHGWQVESSKFADNMTIVASLGLHRSDRYLIGAFVGGECRGVGSMVKDDIAFISVAGKSGEKVSFRLMDTLSGETFDINESLTYTQKAGSMKAPISLTSDGATAIETVRTATTTHDKAIYDLNGRRVERPAKGIYIVNGKKVVF